MKTVSYHYQRLGIDAADVNRLITLVLDMINNSIFQDSDNGIRSDYINHVLNSTPGRLYLALIELTKLWAYVFSPKDEQGQWPVAVKEHFTQLVGSHAAKDNDFSIILGMEMRYVLYESRKEKVPLQGEVAFINSFINLENLECGNQRSS